MMEFVADLSERRFQVCIVLEVKVTAAGIVSDIHQRRLQACSLNADRVDREVSRSRLLGYVAVINLAELGSEEVGRPLAVLFTGATIRALRKHKDHFPPRLAGDRIHPHMDGCPQRSQIATRPEFFTKNSTENIFV